ncbi:MAG: di-heme enzyme [Sediminibacterium sp.]|nr:di-heme enzyme [Sediminibacterium sp.]
MKKGITAGLLLLLFAGIGFGLTEVFSGTSNSVADNRITLGRYLFYDTRMSYNLTKSCGSCHDPQFAFSDGYRTSSGADGYNVKRNAPSLINVRFAAALTWADSSIRNVEQQMNFPLFNEHPRELGWKGHEPEILHRITEVPMYGKLFQQAFPGEPEPVNRGNIIRAIAAFEEQLVSFDAPYDRYLRGNKLALSAEAVRGMQLFHSAELACSRCHVWQPTQQPAAYYNTGLYNLDGEGAYPEEDQGLFEYTKNKADKGKFRVPSLRNVMLTAPYTHNGSVASIHEMISIYQRGGRSIASGAFMGDGAENVHKSPLVKGFDLPDADRKALVAFLNSLTDSAYLKKPDLMNPFNQ